MSILKKVSKVTEKQPVCDRNAELLARHYSNYLEILENIKRRPRMPLPGETQLTGSTGRPKRIRWNDRHLTRSSSSDHIYGIPCNHKLQQAPCNIIRNNSKCSKSGRCSKQRNQKLSRSASTNMIAETGLRREERHPLHRNVSCRHVNESQYHHHDCHRHRRDLAEHEHIHCGREVVLQNHHHDQLNPVMNKTQNLGGSDKHNEASKKPPRRVLARKFQVWFGGKLHLRGEVHRWE